MKPKGLAKTLLETSALTTAIIICFAAGSAHAQATWVGDTSADWNNAANWSTDPANPTGNFTINGAGITPVLNANSAFTPVDVIVGVGATGRFDHTAGTLSTGNGNWFIVGRNASGNGTYNLADTTGSGGTFTGFAQGSGSLTVGGTSTTSGRLILGDTSNSVGTVNMNTSGTMTLEDDAIGLLMGNGGTSTGNFNLDGGTLQINSVTNTGIAILVGTNGGDGNFRMSGGTVNTVGGVWVGDNNAGSQGLINITGGTFTATATGTNGSTNQGQFFIGRGLGQGTMTVSGTSNVTLNGSTHIGFSNTATAGTTGTLNVNGGTFINNGEMRVGSAQNSNSVTARGTGTLNVTGGSATINGGLLLARTNDATDLVTGNVSVSGGTLTVRDDFVAGVGGAATVNTVNISGGTVNISSTAGEKWFIVNQFDTAIGQVTVSGGTMNLNNNSDFRFSTGNSTGTSFATLSGTGAITGGVTSVVDLMQANVAGNNTFNLDGGTLTISQVLSNSNNGTAAFNFNGGTLKASADSVDLLALGGASQRANVRNGGAMINTNGNNVSISESLQHSNVGGDNAIDGGLTKSGAGTLTLSAVNTYNGATTISAGTLALGASASLASTQISVSGGATYDVSAQAYTVASGVTVTNNGTVNGGFTVASGGTLNGSGTFNNAVTVSGNLNPGNSPGSQTYVAGLTLAAATTTMEIAGLGGVGGTDFDYINVTGGTLTFDGTLAVVDFGGHDISGQTAAYNLFDFVTGAGDFDVVTVDGNALSYNVGTDDWSATVGSTTYNFAEGTGVLSVTVVPEPTAALLGGIGLLGLLRRRRQG